MILSHPAQVLIILNNLTDNMSNRIAKSNALRAIQNTIESGETESVIVDIDEEVTLEETQSSVPVVTQNAPEGMSLDGSL